MRAGVDDWGKNCLGRSESKSECRSAPTLTTMLLPSLCRYAQAELIHGRTAMAAVAGILIPSVSRRAELFVVPAARSTRHGPCINGIIHSTSIVQLLTKAGALNVPEWYEAGKVYLEQPGAIAFGE